MTLDELLRVVRGSIVVSCQASEGHPLRHTETIARIALAAEAGGAAAIRCGGVGGVADVAAVAQAVSLPVIGLTKVGTEGVYITPSASDARALLAAGAHVVAADATRRERPGGEAFVDLVEAVHGAGGLVMADISDWEEAVDAARAGADLVATTLSGYTGGGEAAIGPDLDLVARVARALPGVPVIAEGRYHRPEHAQAALAAGATAVVVGTAITDPAWITAQFVSEARRGDRSGGRAEDLRRGDASCQEGSVSARRGGSGSSHG